MNTKTRNLKKNKNYLNGFTASDIGDDHLYTGVETPMKLDAFKMSDNDKKRESLFYLKKLWM